jgi:hypothetical protein
VKKHISLNGIDSSYTCWNHHGESLDAHHVIEYPTDVHDKGVVSYMRKVCQRIYYSADRLEGVLGDLHTAAKQARQDGHYKKQGNVHRFKLMNIL